MTVDITERKQAEQLRDAFLSVLSHELRTPITTITAGAQFLAARGEQLEAADRGELTGDIAAEAERLNRMMDDLLVLARTERGVDLTARGPILVQRRLEVVLAGVAAEWPNREFAAEVPEFVPAVSGDDGYLDQVLWNLLGNAAKYGRRRVTVRVETQGEEVDLTVSDDGPGIPPADRERIFELFTRLEQTTRLPGTGIGLFVARRLVDAMAGRLTVGDGPDGGAAFRVTLRRYPGHQVEDEDTRSVAHSGA